MWNLETGIKQTLGDFAYNASVYRYNYDNRQAVRLIDPDPNNPTDIPRFVVDTGDLEAWGLEADARWQVSKAFSLAAMTAGAQLVAIAVPRGVKRYLRVNYTVATGPLTGGTFNAGLVKDVQDIPGIKQYASGFVIDPV